MEHIIKILPPSASSPPAVGSIRIIIVKLLSKILMNVSSEIKTQK